MADANLILERAGGRLNVETGQLLSATDVDRIGGMALQTLMSFLSVFFMDEPRGVPMTGFPRDVLSRDHCRVSATGNLSFQVNTGFGMLYNSAATADEFGPDEYMPIVVDSVISDSLAAHDPTNPRIDLVCLAPAWIDDQTASRNIKNPSSGAISSASVAQRRRLGATYQIVTGTPASSPSVPSVPAGYTVVGLAEVPAASGAAVWQDTREVLQLGTYFKSQPAYATSDYVPLGTSSELEVTASSPAAMTVEVAEGRAVIGGMMRAFRGGTLTITTADATNPRIDLITARQDGALVRVTGTPAATPAVPALPSNSVPLAEVLVPALAGSVTTARITDVRQRGPIANTEVQERSLDHSKLAFPTVKITVDDGSISGLNTESGSIPFTVAWPDGDPLPEGSYLFEAELITTFTNSGSTTPGEYGDAGSQSSTIYLPGDPPSDAFLHFLAPGTNLTAVPIDGLPTDLYTHRMVFELTDPTDPDCTIEVRRVDTLGNPDVRVILRPISHPGGGDVADLSFVIA